MIRFNIFVDGSNLFGSLKRLKLHVIEYEKFFSYILKQATNLWKASIIEGTSGVRLNRVLWYEVGSIDDWDLEDRKTQETLLEWFKLDKQLQRSYLEQAGRKLSKAGTEEVAREAWNICLNEIKTWYSFKKENVRKGVDFQFGVKSSTDFIDIIPSGHLKVDILNKNVTEKGLDTSLAVDMLSLADSYDVALLISGDADSIPSIQKVKHMGKHVGVVEFINGYPPEKKGRQSSTKLKAIADFVVPIYETDLQREGLTKSS